MAKRNVIPPKAATMTKRQFRVEHIQNVRKEDVDRVIFELQSDDNYVGSDVYPEGDGEFTIVAVFRDE